LHGTDPGPRDKAPSEFEAGPDASALTESLTDSFDQKKNQSIVLLARAIDQILGI
jgi:hypothetical protein